VIGILPIIVGRSIEPSAEKSGQYSRLWRVIFGLGISVLLFSILLKATTLLIDVPLIFWQMLSGGIITLFGITALFPSIWERLAMFLKIPTLAQKSQQNALQKKGKWGDVLLGASLGPIFTACSPTYLLILAVILPTSPIEGLFYLLCFIVGLLIGITSVAILGNSLLKKIGWAVNPHGMFKKVIGILCIVVGIIIILGIDKSIQTYFVENGYFDWQLNLEESFNQL
jgi:cytochrome c biogenesis protein CcdA